MAVAAGCSVFLPRQACVVAVRHRACMAFAHFVWHYAAAEPPAAVVQWLVVGVGYSRMPLPELMIVGGAARMMRSFQRKNFEVSERSNTEVAG